MKWLYALIAHFREVNSRIFPPHEWEYRQNPDTLADERFCACGQCEEFIFGSGMGGDDWKVLIEGDMSMHQTQPAPAAASPARPRPVEDAATPAR